MESQSQEYWNDLSLDGPSVQINDVTMDSQTDDLPTYSHYRETHQTRQRASSFSDLFQLGVSQEIQNNNNSQQQVLVRQNSITTIPTLFPGLPSTGSFLAKAAAEYEEPAEVVPVKVKRETRESTREAREREKLNEIEREKNLMEISENNNNNNVAQKRKLESQPSPKSQQKKVKREIKTEQVIPENTLLECNLGLSELAILQQNMRLDSVDGVLPEAVINDLTNIEMKIQEILQEEAANRVTVNQIFTKQQKYFDINNNNNKKNDEKTMNELLDEQTKLLAKISTAITSLEEIVKTCLLNYYTLKSMKNIGLNLHIQTQQLTSLRDELNEKKKSGHCNNCFKSWKLVILDQPLSAVVGKGKMLDSSTVISVITGTQRNDLLSNAEIRCSSEPSHFQHTIESDPQRLIKPLTTAAFAKIKLVESSRMAVIRMKYEMPIKDGNKQPLFVLESPISSAVIVTTHENQWIEAAAKLLLVDVFQESQTKVQWCKFANILHSHFVSATKQDQSNPSRPLQQYELQYFHSLKIFNNNRSNQQNKDNCVTKDQVENFFKWFGSVCSLIHYKKHILQFWAKGYIFRFTSKEQVIKLLEYEKPGTFVIRFSESSNGLFSVSYVGTEVETTIAKGKTNKSNNNGESIKKQKVHSYLLKPEDTGPNKSLADFILSHSAKFVTLMQYNALDGSVNKIERDVALSSFYTPRRKNVHQQEGYDEDINW